jgi:hypothetical protein
VRRNDFDYASGSNYYHDAPATDINQTNPNTVVNNGATGGSDFLFNPAGWNNKSTEAGIN